MSDYEDLSINKCADLIKIFLKNKYLFSMTYNARNYGNRCCPSVQEQNRSMSEIVCTIDKLYVDSYRYLSSSNKKQCV